MAGDVAPPRGSQTSRALVRLGLDWGARLYKVSIPIERVIVFPMALIPNLWGLWNMLYVWLSGHRHMPIGLHGALLVVLIVPIGFSVGKLLDFSLPHPFLAVLGPAAALAAYYLLWKYVVNFLNELLLPEAWGAAGEKRVLASPEFPDAAPSPAIQPTKTVLKAPVRDAECGRGRSPDF